MLGVAQRGVEHCNTGAHDAPPSAIALSTMANQLSCDIGSKVTPNLHLMAAQNSQYLRSFRFGMCVSVQTPLIDTSQ
jgi:hypothetical protein